MTHQINAVAVDEGTILIDGHTVTGIDEAAEVLALALQSDPNVILLIESTPTAHYRAIGMVIYASQRVGVPLGNIRWTTDDGDVISFGDLKARSNGQVRPETDVY
ncbi:hypothetical protein [Massilia sp.]|uniref:hypothetical protein n=1 Tax=Massilia sp. TaxID=1882437 RepID=UPI002898CFD1|nr:hypothetical protein [Massilia sp.]